MFGTTRGTLVPARKHLLALTLAVIASVPIAASADPGMVDVRTLPRLEGAEAPSRIERTELIYSAPTAVAVTTANTRAMLATAGWVQYLRPMYGAAYDTSLHFKKGNHTFYVGFTRGLGGSDQSTVSYRSDRLVAELPFPDGATNIIYDHRRAYLNCVAPGTVAATADFFRDELIAAGWSPLSTADIAVRWPNARLDGTIESGVRAYYSHPTQNSDYRQPPIMLSLQARGDGATSVEIKRLPQNLVLARETAGLPVPNQTDGFGSEGKSNSSHHELYGTVAAELPAVLAFFRRELAARDWKEEAGGAVTTPDEAVLNFSSAEQTGTLRLVRKYDQTNVSLVTRVKEAALAARAKAKKEADARFLIDAAAMAKETVKADEARRPAQAANLSEVPLRALADNATPVPLPETAENVKFEGTVGRLEFDAPSSVRAVTAFYRGALMAQGWKEQPSVVNEPSIVVMNFSKDRKTMSFTVLQLGRKTRIAASGSALVMADAKMPAKPGAAGVQASNEPVAKTTDRPLEADPDSALPLPKEHSMTSMGTGKMPGSDAPFRRDLEASIPAELGSVLAFYRSELGKRGWKEQAEGAVMKPDQVRLAFASSDGPATLKLGRRNSETSVNLAQKYPAAAAKADIIPKPGQAKLVFGNMGDGEATVTINKQTIKVAGGAGGPQSPSRPMLELPPGKYQYSVKLAGRPAKSDSVEVTANDAWGFMIAPSGEALSLQIY